MEIQELKQKIVFFIKEKAGDKPVVLGLSGGIDSALVAYLAVEALGPSNVYGVILPSSTNSNQDLIYAKKIATNLNLQSLIFNLEPILKAYQESTNKLFFSKKSLGNLKARIRMSISYGKANELNALVLGTGNKTELMVGYFTKYGDGGVDLLPIGDLYKIEVRELAKYIGVPQEIIDRAPTAGLWEGQTDEGELGITYKKLDKILMAIERGENLEYFDKDDVEQVKQRIKNAGHKLRTPPICKI
ncbi:MAG: NAD+ synthase [Candidatus Magasanikbacteria bacterium]